MPKSIATDAYREMLALLSAARHNAGVTQVELAKRLKKPQPWVSSVETGVRRLDAVEFYAIARALDVDPTALFAAFVAKLPKRVRI